MEKYVTPIHILRNMSKKNNIFIKREDLYPFSFGGNKVKIGKEFLKDALNKGCDTVISYGSYISNLNRAIVSLCKKNNLDCFLVVPSENEKEIFNFNKKLNLLNISEKNIYKCSKNNVANTLENLIQKLKFEGKNPYYINGSIYGEGNEKTAILAYEKCYREILEYEINNNIYFDYIFLATGTGMTQSGLILGKIKNNDKNRKIIGISVAREKIKGIEAIKKYLKSSLSNEEIDERDIEFLDQYIAGGYGKFSEGIIKKIKEMYQEEGIPLDLIYTGKAFYGMEKYLEEENIKGKNILFIHTGGTPLFFNNIDYLLEQKEEGLEKIKIVTEKDKNLSKEIIKFLKKTDSLFEIPLSQKINIEEYGKKLLEFADILLAYEDNKIIGIFACYNNDNVSKVSNAVILAILEEYQGKGIAKKLLETGIELAKKRKMIRMKLSTRNLKALNIYKKMKFKELFKTKNEYYLEKNLEED